MDTTKCLLTIKRLLTQEGRVLLVGGGGEGGQEDGVNWRRFIHRHKGCGKGRGCGGKEAEVMFQGALTRAMPREGGWWLGWGHSWKLLGLVNSVLFPPVTPGLPSVAAVSESRAHQCRGDRQESPDSGFG